jgi:hypothetical protein
MRKYKTRGIAVVVAPEGESILSEMSTEIRVADEMAGEFVEVEQVGNVALGKIQITPEEWPHLRKAIDRMIKQCTP